MNFIISIIRTLFRHRWLILVGTAIFTLLVFYYTRHMQGGYDVKATLYTGVASGYNLESDKRTDWATVQNSMDNLISIMQAESTLKRVFLRLFARVLIQGNPDNDNDGVTPSSYNYTYNHLKNSPHGPEILKLIDKSSEDKTVANLEAYMRPKKGNYIYEMFYYNHPFYSYNALKNIKVQRRLTSDLLDISYTSGDPGIAYNTVSILMDEFVEEYRRIRYGETDKVIKYFEEELKRIGKKTQLGGRRPDQVQRRKNVSSTIWTKPKKSRPSVKNSSCGNKMHFLHTTVPSRCSKNWRSTWTAMPSKCSRIWNLWTN